MSYIHPGFGVYYFGMGFVPKIASSRPQRHEFFGPIN
jgi:hypothetical protein